MSHDAPRSLETRAAAAGIDRRTLLAATAATGLATAAAGCAPTGRLGAPAPATGTSLPAWYGEIEERTFRFFWETVNRTNGLVPDRWPNPPFSSIAAVGFGLTCYPIGVERGWCTRAEVRDLTLTTLRFFTNLPQGDAMQGTSGHRGFFYHFLDMNTGLRFGNIELSSVDSTLLFLGMLFAGAYYDRDDPAEAEIRRLADALYARADWAWFMNDRPVISMGWFPDKGFIERSWDGYNEGMMVVTLALGAPLHPIPADGWNAWTAPYPKFWRGQGDTRHLAFAPMFGHQYSHLWIDYRGIADAPMRDAGFDYFENSRRATYANRAYCAANPMGWDGYSRDVWGLTACDGPGNFTIAHRGEQRTIYGYSARGPVGQPDGRDDGTLSPTAALGCLPFAPEIVVPCAQAMIRTHGSRLYGRYGFLDAFNPTIRSAPTPLETGTVDPVHGWVGRDHIAIDQGPILAMAANHRDDFVWARMRRVPAIRLGLERAGFTGGWLG